MAKEERLNLGDGVAIQRRGKVWWIDVYRSGERFRDSLHTTDRAVAVTIGGAVLGLLQKHERAIHLLAQLIPALRQIRPQAMARTFALANGDPEVLRSMEETWKLIPEFPEEIVAKWEHGLIGRLRDLALEGVKVEDLLRRAVREEVHGPASTAATPWEDALKDFSKSKKFKVEPETLKNLLRDVREFAADTKVPCVQEASSAHVDKWVSDLQANGASPSTAWNKRASLSSFFSWARKVAKLIRSNPVSDTEPPTVEDKDPEYLTRDQALQRMDRVKGHRMEWVAGISLYCGIRLGDIARLDPVRDIDIPGRNIRVRNTDEGSEKRGVQRNVAILDQALPFVRMFPKGGFPWKDTKHVSKTLCSLGAGNLLLRHTLETHLRIVGVTPKAAGDIWLGHTEETGSRNYSGWWKPSEPPMKLTYFGLPLVPHGVPEVPTQVREAFKA